MIAPMIAPATAPEIDTVARAIADPRDEDVQHDRPTAAARATAGAMRRTRRRSPGSPATARRPPSAGTEMLSSSRIGIVSTNAAAIAARIGASDSEPAWRRRVDAPGPPGERDASGRCKDNEACRAGDRLVRDSMAAACRGHGVPTSVAAPSPNARMPQAAAAMSSRDGKIRISSSTASRIQQDAEREIRAHGRRDDRAASADARQQEQVEHQRRGGQRRGLPPGERAQQQCKGARSDVHPLPRVLRVHRHAPPSRSAIEAIVR